MFCPKENRNDRPSNPEIEPPAGPQDPRRETDLPKRAPSSPRRKAPVMERGAEVMAAMTQWATGLARGVEMERRAVEMGGS